MSTSRDVARQLRQIADKLDAAPEFELEEVWHRPHFMWQFDKRKDQFLAAVRALGGQKMYSDDDIDVETSLPSLRVCLSAKRSAVCRMVKPAEPAVYDCTPLLTPEEEKELA